MADAKVEAATSRTNAVSSIFLSASLLPATSVGERASSKVKSESLLANQSGLWEEGTLEIENLAFRHLENQKLLRHSTRNST